MNIKKTMAIMLSAVMVCSSASAIDACKTLDGGIWVIRKDESESDYIYNTKTGERIVESWVLDNTGNKVVLDHVEYVKELNQQEEFEFESPIEKNTSLGQISDDDRILFDYVTTKYT